MATGQSAEDIAAEEGTSNAIRHSITWCEGRLSNAQVVEGRKTRLRRNARGRADVFQRLAGCFYFSWSHRRMGVETGSADVVRPGSIPQCPLADHAGPRL